MKKNPQFLIFNEDSEHHILSLVNPDQRGIEFGIAFIEAGKPLILTHRFIDEIICVDRHQFSYPSRTPILAYLESDKKIVGWKGHFIKPAELYVSAWTVVAIQKRNPNLGSWVLYHPQTRRLIRGCNFRPISLKLGETLNITTDQATVAI